MHASGGHRSPGDLDEGEEQALLSSAQDTNGGLEGAAVDNFNKEFGADKDDHLGGRHGADIDLSHHD